MTVQELIDLLNKIEDKTLIVTMDGPSMGKVEDVYRTEDSCVISTSIYLSEGSFISI